MSIEHSEQYKEFKCYRGTIDNYCIKQGAAEALCLTIMNGKLDEIAKQAKHIGPFSWLNYGKMKLSAGTIVIGCEKDKELINGLFIEEGEPYCYPETLVVQDITAYLIEKDPEKYGYLDVTVNEYLKKAQNIIE